MLLVAVALFSGCGSDDGDGDDPSASTDALCAEVRESVFGSGRSLPPDQAREKLTGDTFVSSAVCGRKLAPGTQIKVGFTASPNGDTYVSFEAGCNGMEGQVQFTAESLKVSRISSTLVGCPDPLAEQDAWLTQFFESDPEWRLQGNRLTLASEDEVIELTRRGG